jgi:hypothetical protein
MRPCRSARVLQVGAIDLNCPGARDGDAKIQGGSANRPYQRAMYWLWLIFLIMILAAAGPAFADKDKGKNKGTKKKKNLASPTASASPSEQSLTNIPLPIGHEAKGLVLPDFDLEGHLRGKFVASTARRIDEEHIRFQDLKITTFTPENQTDLQIDMQTSLFDLKTKILSSQERATVKRADFDIVGDSIQFDTNTRTGRMIGNVKMVITSQSHLLEKTQE